MTQIGPDLFEESTDPARRITAITRRDTFDYIRTDGGPWWGRLMGQGSAASEFSFGPMRAYALVELGDDQAVDVFVRREDAFAALDDAIKDEPDWAGMLSVVPIELESRGSPN